MSWFKSILEALAIAFGLVKTIRDEVEEPDPELIDPPPPADKSGLVHELEEIRKKKFGS